LRIANLQVLSFERRTMTDIAEAIYIATTRMAGGRGPRTALGRDGYLDIRLSFRRGYGCACFEDAVGLAALRLKAVRSDDAAIDAEVDLGVVDLGGTHSLQASLNVRLGGLPPGLARGLSGTARETGPHAEAMGADTNLMIEKV